MRYGPSTVVVDSAGSEVNWFTLDRAMGAFFLTHPNIRVPEGVGNYSVNEANEPGWGAATWGGGKVVAQGGMFRG